MADMATAVDPRNSGCLDPAPIGSTKTNASGTAIVQIEYPLKNLRLRCWCTCARTKGVRSRRAQPAGESGFRSSRSVLAGDPVKVPPPAFVNSKMASRIPAPDTR